MGSKTFFVLITPEDEGNTQHDLSKPRDLYPKGQGVTSPKLGIFYIMLDLYCFFSDIRNRVFSLNLHF